MAFNLRNRSFLKEIDFTPAELRFKPTPRCWIRADACLPCTPST